MIKILRGYNNLNYEAKKKNAESQNAKYTNFSMPKDDFKRSKNISFSGENSALKKVTDIIRRGAYTEDEIFSEKKIQNVVSALSENLQGSLDKFSALLENLPQNEKAAGQIFVTRAKQHPHKNNAETLSELASEYRDEIITFQKNFRKRLLGMGQVNLSEATYKGLETALDENLFTEKVIDIRPHSSSRHGVNKAINKLIDKNFTESIELKNIQNDFNSTLDKRRFSPNAKIAHWFTNYGKSVEEFAKKVLNPNKESVDHIISQSSAKSRKEYNRLQKQHNKVPTSVIFNRDIKSDSPLYHVVSVNPELNIPENLATYIEDLQIFPQIHALKRHNMEKALKKAYQRYNSEIDESKKKKIDKEIQKLTYRLERKAEIDRAYNSLRHKYGSFNDFINALKNQFKTALTPPPPKPKKLHEASVAMSSKQAPAVSKPITQAKISAEQISNLSTNIDTQITTVAMLSQQAAPIAKAQQARTIFLKKIQNITSTIAGLERSKSQHLNNYNAKITPLETQIDLANLGLKKDVNIEELKMQIRTFRQSRDAKVNELDTQIKKTQTALEITNCELNKFDVQNLTPDALKKLISNAKSTGESTIELEQKLQEQQQIITQWRKSKADLIVLIDDFYKQTGKSYDLTSYGEIFG